MLRRRTTTTETYSRLHHLAKKTKVEEKPKIEDKEDMITELPVDVRGHILSFLSTKYAVSTTALSRRWKNLWTLVSMTNLEFDDRLLLNTKSNSETIDRHPSLFSDFVNRVLALVTSPTSCIHKLTLSCIHPYDPSHINSWLHSACKHNLKEIDIRIYSATAINPIKLPASLYGSTWLVVLKLNANVEMDISDSVCFPRLKVLWVKVFDPDDENLTQKLFSDHICPMLEELSIEGELSDENTGVGLLVVSNSLKRLKIEYRTKRRFQDYNSVLRCPNLERLDIYDDFLAKFIARDLEAVDHAKICIGHSDADYAAAINLYDDVNRPPRAFEILEALSNVKTLLLSGCTTEALSYAYETAGHSSDDDQEISLLMRLRKLELDFRFLTCLELGFCTSESWKLLTLLLHRSPILEKLIINKELDLSSGGYKTRAYHNWRPEKSVPECMLLCLKEIEINGFQGEPNQLEFEFAIVDFFLEYAEVLQKMTIHVIDTSLTMFSEHVLQITTASDACQVEIIK